MHLITLSAASDTFQRCTACGWLMRPTLLCRHHDGQRDAFYCLRCYHILSAVTILRAEAKKGVDHADS